MKMILIINMIKNIMLILIKELLIKTNKGKILIREIKRKKIFKNHNNNIIVSSSNNSIRDNSIIIQVKVIQVEIIKIVFKKMGINIEIQEFNSKIIFSKITRFLSNNKITISNNMIIHKIIKISNLMIIISKIMLIIISL